MESHLYYGCGFDRPSIGQLVRFIDTHMFSLLILISGLYLLDDYNSVLPKVSILIFFIDVRIYFSKESWISL